MHFSSTGHYFQTCVLKNKILSGILDPISYYVKPSHIAPSNSLSNWYYAEHQLENGGKQHPPGGCPPENDAKRMNVSDWIKKTVDIYRR